MASEKQIAANRRNSQHSTGPRTEAGKQTSSLNALKSGLHAESHIVRGENPDDLAQLTAEYYAEFRPTTPRQRDLVDTVVHNQWLIRRLRLTEADLYAHHYQHRDDDFEEKWRFKVLQREHPLADAFSSLEKRLLRLQSRLNSLERSTRAAIKELVGPVSRPARDLQVAQPVETETSTDQIGFVPSDVVATPEEHTPLSPDPGSLSPQILKFPLDNPSKPLNT